MQKNKFNLLPILIVLFFSASAFASTPPESDIKILFEISDKYNEVQLGVTESTVYMIFSDEIRELANKLFLDQHKKDVETFADSEGNFIMDEMSYLESNKIEYDFEDIKKLNFENGVLSFDYATHKKIKFEDIFSFNGTKALNNFFVEDLELFAIKFQKLALSS
ncbi:MAG: hypothetical protein RLN81_08825 [Balneolaceae bacterium]